MQAEIAAKVISHITGAVMDPIKDNADKGVLKNDQFLFPVVISARTYAVAGLCVVAAGVASALVVRRQIDRLDMVGALKTRE